MLFKMLGIERAWKQFPDMWDKPRQIFVTQSRVLATKVEEYFSKLMLSLETASYSPEELRKMGKNVEQDTGLIDLDDMDQWRPDLPRKFSELTDDNFPLFITYDRVRGEQSAFWLFAFDDSDGPGYSFVLCFRTTLGKRTTTMGLSSLWPRLRQGWGALLRAHCRPGEIEPGGGR